MRASAQVYENWSAAMQLAWQLEDKVPKAESTLAVVADAYRQGHNLDVEGTGPKAIQTIERCLADYPDSLKCHLTASYIYLSINPAYASKGEASLLRMRELLKDQPNKEVERGMVFAYLYQQKMEAGLKQLDHYLNLFPSDGDMRQLREYLAKGRFEVKHVN